MTIVCPHCNDQVIDEGICTSCKRICPANPERSHYQVLGYKDVRLVLDPEDLERRFFCLSRIFHPDRYSGKSAAEQRFAHDHSSAINAAYRTLRDPFSRVQYVVEHELGDALERSKKVSPDTAELIFEVQDLLETLHEADTPSEALLCQVRSSQTELLERLDTLESRILVLCSEYDSTRSDSTLAIINELLSERNYINSSLRTMETVLGEKGITAGI
jgi:molecular chaperone HscB